MAGREAFLARVRARLVDGIPDNPLRPVVGIGEPVPAVDYTVDTADLVQAFAAAARAVGADVRDGADRDALVRETCEAHDVRRAVVSADPECAGVRGLLLGSGVDVAAPEDRPAVAAADLGVTGAAYGVALTGSLVLDSERAGARTASLLPPVHLAFLRRKALLATPGDLWRHLPDRLPGGLPSNLVLVTGPSRSSDIELELTVGVHGPRVLIIGLLDDAEA